MITPSHNPWKDMKTFIALSKIWREKYKKNLPFIYVMAKRLMREDLQRTITDYIVFKSDERTRKMIKPSSNPWKNATWILAILLILSLTGNYLQIRHAENEHTARMMEFERSNTLIAQKQGEILIRDSLISTIRKERHSDSLKNSVSQNALKQRVAILTAKIEKLPTKIVYNPDSATVDSLRVSFALKDSVIDTQALMIMNLETEKQGLFASFTREVQQLMDNRNDQIVITNQLQTQLVEEQGNTRKEKRKRKFWRTVSVAAAGGIAFLLLKPN